MIRRRSRPRRGPLRDKGFIAYLHQFRCEACLRLNHWPPAKWTVAAHGPVNGMSSKGPDNEAIPLCGGIYSIAKHHEEQHSIGWPAFEAKYGFSRAEEAAKHWAAYQIWKEGK